MRRIALIALTVFLLPSGANATTVEARCTDLGSACVCSEPLDTDDGTNLTTSHNFTNSPSGTDCDAFGAGKMMDISGNVDCETATELPVGAVAGFALNIKDAGTQAFSGDADPNGPARECLRWYFKAGDSFVTACDAPINHKVMTVDGFSGGGHSAFQLEELDLCPSVTGPPWNNFEHFSTSGEADVGTDCGAYQAKCDDSDPGAVATTFDWNDCNDSWCRIELCIGNRGEGASLADSPQLGPWWMYIYLLPLDGVSTEYEATVYLGDSEWDADGMDNFAINMSGGFDHWIRYVMQARWSSDSGQRIGAASEMGDGGSTTPGSQGSGSFTLTDLMPTWQRYVAARLAR